VGTASQSAETSDKPSVLLISFQSDSESDKLVLQPACVRPTRATTRAMISTRAWKIYALAPPDV
jgi:hypothetical protein